MLELYQRLGKFAFHVCSDFGMFVKDVVLLCGVRFQIVELVGFEVMRVGLRSVMAQMPVTREVRTFERWVVVKRIEFVTRRLFL